MRRLRRLGVGMVAGLLLVLSVGAVARADGLPAPLPGVTSGPDGGSIKQLAEGYGLSCQPDTGINGLSEWSCTRANASDAVRLSAAFYADPALVLEAFAFTTDLSATEPAAFVTQMVAPFCTEQGPQAVASFVADAVAAGIGAEPRTFEDATCSLQLTYMGAADAASLVVLAYAKGGGSPSSSMSDAASPSEGAAPSEAPPSSPVPSSGASAGSFFRAVATPDRVSTDPLVIVESAALAMLFVFLMPFPSQLFNATLEEHWEEVRGWFGMRRLTSIAHGLADAWNRPIGIALFVAVSALLYGFLDPAFGISLESLAEVIGLALGIVLTTVAFAAPAILASRRAGEAWRLHVLPGTLLVGIGCVLVTRLTGFQPGYLYGLVIGVQLARELSGTEEGRETARAALVMLVAAGLSWIGLAVVGEGDLGVAGLAVQTTLAATMVAGLEGVAFGLLPLRFLPGEPLYAWNRLLWGALLAIGAFAFFHILINPSSGYLSDTSRTPLFTIVALFVGFGIVSVGFWAYFRFRRAPSAAG